MKDSNLLHYKGYSAKPEYSAADQLFYGKILGIDDLVDLSAKKSERIPSENTAGCFMSVSHLSCTGKYQ